MVNSFGINVDVKVLLLHFNYNSAFKTLPALHRKLWKPNLNSLFRDNYSHILHRETIFSSPNTYPPGAEQPQGHARTQGWAQGRGSSTGGSGKLWPSRPSRGEGMRSISSGCFNPTGSTAAKQQQGQTFGPLKEISPVTPVIPWGAITLPELSALLFSLCCVVSVQTKAPERTYIYNLLSLQTAKEDAVHQSGPKGADILTPLMAV